MVDMSEIYKNKKKALVRGSGDLATGVGVALYRAGFQVIMTDIAVPLTVRREVAMSRAVYEGRAKVEGIEGILVRNYQEALAVLEENKIAVIVDPKAEIRKEFHPDLLVDAILAKKNMGTRRCVVRRLRISSMTDSRFRIPASLDMWVVMRWSA